VDTAVSFDNVTHLSNLEAQRRFFEWSLHLTFVEGTQISTFACGGAVRIFLGKLSEFIGRAVDLDLITLEDFDGLLLGTSDVGLRTVSAMVRSVAPNAERNKTHLSPARGTPALAMLDEEVACSHTVILEVLRCTRECIDLALCHTRRRCPARLARVAVRWCSEVVGNAL
jgi:hypothetical protein